MLSAWRAMVVVAGILCCGAAATAGVFTYQGRLVESGQPASGPLNLAFRLYDAASGGVQIGTEQVFVGFNDFAAGGEFSVNLDFGPTAFPGANRWIEVWVSGAPLAPRQQVRATPYAMHATIAAMVPDGGLPGTYTGAVSFTSASNSFSGSGAGLGSLNASNMTTGTVAGGRLAGTYGNAMTFSNAANSFTGNGGGLTNLNWNNLINVPAGFADGTDNDTIVWSTSGPDAYYTAGKVGIGTKAPAFQLHVTSNSGVAVYGIAQAFGLGISGIIGRSDGPGGNGVFGYASSTTTNTNGVYGLSDSSSGVGVYGASSFTGVQGSTDGESGQGIYGISTLGSGTGTGVRGETASPTGYAGYFLGGRNYFSGNIGIGTSDPTSGLQVEGTGFPKTFVTMNATSATGDAGLRLNRQGTVRWHLFNSGTTSDVFGIYNTAFSPVLATTQAGNVGLGTTAPAFQLHLSTNSAAKPTSSAWTISSDRRLKKDIHTIEHALDDLLALRGVTYQWRDPSSQGDMAGTYTGMIAQEVETVFPEWIGEGKNGYKTLTVIGFEGIVVEAMRELDDRITARNSEITRLHAVIERQQLQLDAILNRLESLETGLESPSKLN